MKQSKEIFIEQYIDYIVKMEKAMLKDDYRTNNRYARKLTKLTEKYENEEYYIESLGELMDSDNLKVNSIAAADSLRHNCNIDKAVRTLEKISSREENGIVALGAEIALQRWREKGAEGIQ